MSAAYDAALKSGNPRIGIFFRLDLDPDPFRMWLGVGDCEAGIDASDGNGEIYRGAGEMLNVPVFQQLLNAVAERVTFSISGVSERVSRLASSDSDTVKGVSLRIGLGVFDPDWQLIQAPTWLKYFIVDYLSHSREQTRDGMIYTVALSTRSIFTARRRPGLSFFTDEEQQRRSPGDRFCEHAQRYSQVESKAWPRG